MTTMANSWPVGGYMRRPSGLIVTDPYWSSVVLLADSNVGSTGIVNPIDRSASAKAISIQNSATLSTNQAKFGTASMRAERSSSRHWSVGDSADWSMGTGDFTFDIWAYINSISGDEYFFGQWGGGGARSFLFGVNPNGSLGFGWSTDGTNMTNLVLTAAGAVATGGWHLISAARVSGTLRLFSNGVEKGSGTVSGANFNSGDALRIGSLDGSYGNCDAYFQEARITKGVGRYSSGFTLPTTAFPRS